MPAPQLKRAEQAVLANEVERSLKKGRVKQSRVYYR